jgi:hypothetical protein
MLAPLNSLLGKLDSPADNGSIHGTGTCPAYYYLARLKITATFGTKLVMLPKNLGSML